MCLKYDINRNVNCNLCGADDYRVLFPAGKAQLNQIVECRRCGMIYANPRSGELDFARVASSDPKFLGEMLCRSDGPRLVKERGDLLDEGC